MDLRMYISQSRSQKTTKRNSSGMLNPLFKSLTCYTSGHFVHWSYGARKKTTQLAKYPPVSYVKLLITCIYYQCRILEILNTPVRFTSFR